MRQADILLETEGDAWLERNRTQLGNNDPVSDLIESAGIRPNHVLEIGASNGWRLRKLRDRYGCVGVGLDPSAQAAHEALDAGTVVYRGTADKLPFPDASFDLVICGFFFYFLDPPDHFRVVAEADRVLADGGALVMFDFSSTHPHSRGYAHDPRIRSYHFDPERLWLAHPAYRRIGNLYNPITTECATAMRKDMANAFPTALVAP